MKKSNSFLIRYFGRLASFFLMGAFLLHVVTAYLPSILMPVYYLCLAAVILLILYSIRIVKKQHS